ncbi:MAG: hypothetical protein ACTTJH_04840 [Bacteroidales bacterium]
MTLRKQLSQKIGLFEIKFLCKKESKEKIFSLIFDNEQKISQNATWILTHLPKSENKWINSKRDLLIDKAMCNNNTTTIRLYLTLLKRCHFKKSEIRTDFLDYCLKNASDLNNSASIQVLSMKLAYKQCINYIELLKELQERLNLLEANTFSPSIANQRKKIIGKIEKQLQH